MHIYKLIVDFYRRVKTHTLADQRVPMDTQSQQRLRMTACTAIMFKQFRLIEPCAKVPVMADTILSDITYTIIHVLHSRAPP